jgi:K+-transporting ATPase ATPase C chain
MRTATAIVLRRVLVIFGVLSIVTGVAYPLLVTGIVQLAFRAQANGSMLERAGKPVGSALLGQAFSGPGYLPQPYNGASSSGTNLSPTNPAVIDTAGARIKALQAADPGNTRLVPVDLVTASGSGLDPHISPAAADYQVGRVARVRGLPESRVHELIAAHTEGRTLGLLGEPRINVLELNLGLDALK